MCSARWCRRKMVSVERMRSAGCKEGSRNGEGLKQPRVTEEMVRKMNEGRKWKSVSTEKGKEYVES